MAGKRPSTSSIYAYAESLRREMLAEYHIVQEQQYEAAVEATNGYMVNDRGRERGMTGWDVFHGPRTCSTPTPRTNSRRTVGRRLGPGSRRIGCKLVSGKRQGTTKCGFCLTGHHEKHVKIISGRWECPCEICFQSGSSSG